MNYGYARVSTKDQNAERQLIALAPYEIPPENLFLDRQSGKDFERPAYKRLLRRLRPRDVLMVKIIDRLGRNYEEILEQWRLLTKKKHVDIFVLDMPLLDTRKGKDLTGTLIADVVLQLLSYVAQTERENIRQRQAEGIAAAKARGVRFGVPAMEIPTEFYPLHTKWQDGEYSARQAARQLGVDPKTFLKWTKKVSAEDFFVE